MVLHLLVRLERINIGETSILDFGSSNQYFQTWSLPGHLSVLLRDSTHFRTSNISGSLQIGAPSIAFPRRSAAFWAWLVGILIMCDGILRWRSRGS